MKIRHLINDIKTVKASYNYIRDYEEHFAGCIWSEILGDFLIQMVPDAPMVSAVFYAAAEALFCIYGSAPVAGVRP